MAPDLSEYSPTFADPSLGVEQFNRALLAWWPAHQRLYPWRQTGNAFHLLLGELMLRRTRADQVVAVYERFIARYPTPSALATAPSDEVADALYSLGLAWRIPAFQQLANVVLDTFDGIVPDHYHDLITLPGVGDYVASAVCAFAFNQPIAVIDTNTVRIAGRLFALATTPESRRDKRFRELLHRLLDSHRPREYNYAMLDLAALRCTPRNPICSQCPVVAFCHIGQQVLHTTAG
jgi:A/G-specific adenine glycosylase